MTDGAVQCRVSISEWRCVSLDAHPGDGPEKQEWPLSLDVPQLLEKGWRPTPFHQFVIKIHSRCNLACKYCYMYEMADQGWRRQPRLMSPDIIDFVADRIAEHAHANGLRKVELILHGGEPLLAGISGVRHAVTAVRAAAGREVTVKPSLQTNGVLLNTEFLELFQELGVRVSVSLDGDQEGHDRNRLGNDGRGSHERVVAGLERLIEPRYRHLFSGLLSAIDLRNDPVTTYEALLEFRPPVMDFLLPHGTWDSPPPGHSPESRPYGEWLITVFDRWYGAPVRETRVRLFDEILRMLLGRPSRNEAVGLSPVAIAVVETDGSIEQVDTLKVAYDGATQTPLHIRHDSFDAALMLPAIAARQIGRRALSQECSRCEVAEVCGGGLYPHRYRSGTGFANPSVYCADLFRLITHIDQVVRRDVAVIREQSRRRRIEEAEGMQPGYGDHPEAGR